MLTAPKNTFYIRLIMHGAKPPPTYVLMACSVIKRRDNYTLTLVEDEDWDSQEKDGEMNCRRHRFLCLIREDVLYIKHADRQTIEYDIPYINI
jgi:hypothetical protein